MSDFIQADLDPGAERHSEDKILPGVVYGLYLLGFTNGLTFFIGLIVAYVQRGSAGPVNESHYTFAIRTFWLSIAWFLVGLGLVLFGIPLSLVLIGIPMLIAGVVILSAISLWFVIRCIAGIAYLVRGEAYPRPRAWLI
ncbi:hypothetical protein DMC25_17525 [Caulobacter sp. D4A]|uniref:DUF4870 family protein n=1 Tax=Caulobacter sp. D4A TaxID=2204171 RepID=UPI000D72DD85|nr:hypothetical protein [Caulobacter sp. D4A]PXA83848.1 hypothetical protein DMC25_17525 [Caulobacter sp. D4A]